MTAQFIEVYSDIFCKLLALIFITCPYFIVVSQRDHLLRCESNFSHLASLQVRSDKLKQKSQEVL